MPVTNEEDNEAVRETSAVSGKYCNSVIYRGRDLESGRLGEGVWRITAYINLLKFSGYYTYRKV